jgi:hypothetical protein
MIDLHDVIFSLDSNIKIIRGDVAYDADENIVEYDMAQAEAKLAEMQAEEIAKQEAQVIAKDSAMAKLAKLGLTEDEVKALLG